MKEILNRLQRFYLINFQIFPDEVTLNEPVENWPVVDCLISFYSRGFPLAKAIEYAHLRKPLVLNDLEMQYQLQDRFVVPSMVLFHYFISINLKTKYNMESELIITL